MASSTLVTFLALAGLVGLGALMTFCFHCINRRELNHRRDPLYIPRYQFQPREQRRKPENVFEEHELSLLRTKVLNNEELQELLTTRLDQERRVQCSCSSNDSNSSFGSSNKSMGSSNKELLSRNSSGSSGSGVSRHHSIDIETEPVPCDCEQPKNFFTPDCSVCLLDFCAGDNVRILDCGHYFHKNCIDSWLTKHSTLCPVCKADMVQALNLPPRTHPTATSADAQPAEGNAARGESPASPSASPSARSQSSGHSAIELQPLTVPPAVAIPASSSRLYR